MSTDWSDEAEERRKAEADGYYDAWRGWRARPTLLNDDRYADDYMSGYREMRPRRREELNDGD